MANFRRKKPTTRTYGKKWNKWAKNDYWLSNWPKWHDVLYHNRPRRRVDKACLIKALKGYDLDALTWPLSKKPHKYYW